MSIYLIETWVIKPENEEKNDLLWEQFVKYMNDNPKLLSAIKSMKLYKKLTGKNFVTHVQIVEFNSLKDKEVLDKSLSKDRESVALNRKLMLVKDTVTTTEILCEPFLEYG